MTGKTPKKPLPDKIAPEPKADPRIGKEKERDNRPQKPLSGF